VFVLHCTPPSTSSGVQPVPMGTFRPLSTIPSSPSRVLSDASRLFELVTFWQHSAPDEPPPLPVLVVLVEVDLDDVLVGLDVVVGQAVVVALLELVVPQFGFGMAEATLTRARAVMRVLENIVGFVRRKGVVDERREVGKLV
jgi:hypothetical protein